jgi:hypothetical protein
MGDIDIQLSGVLGDIQQSLGRIEQKVDGTSAWMHQHALDDKTQFEEISSKVDTLRIAGAKQRGFISALGAVGTAVGAGVGYLIERWARS